VCGHSGKSKFITVKKYFKYLKINRSFEFTGSIDELMERMEFLSNNRKRFETTRLEDSYYSISAIFSLGAFSKMGGKSGPISVLMRINQNNSINPTIEITSKIRIEHYFFSAMFSFVFFITLLSNEPWYTPVFIVGLFIVFHFWFHLVYRIQENELIIKLKGQLKLVEVKAES
jgi:hypothetical protein